MVRREAYFFKPSLDFLSKPEDVNYQASPSYTLSPPHGRRDGFCSDLSKTITRLDMPMKLNCEQFQGTRTQACCSRSGKPELLSNGVSV
jgi:hypothetical protein